MTLKSCMLKFVPFALLPLLYAVPAAAEDSQRLAISGKVNERDGNVNANYTVGLSGSLKNSGPLLRFDLGYGSSESQSGATNERLRGDALVGYQIAGDSWKVRFYGGVSYDDRKSATAGHREGAGAAFKFEALTDRKGPVSARIGVDFSTRDDTYRVAGRLAFNAGPVFIGPEAAVLGSDYFNSQQVGLVVDNIKLGDVRLSVRGGYGFGSDEGSDRDSPYGGLGLSVQF